MPVSECARRALQSLQERGGHVYAPISEPYVVLRSLRSPLMNIHADMKYYIKTCPIFFPALWLAVARRDRSDVPEIEQYVLDFAGSRRAAGGARAV
jgi:hypothetical protein